MNSELNKLIIEYITAEIETKSNTDDTLESLEVAKQCLEAAWEISDVKKSDTLLNIYNDHKNPKSKSEKKIVTDSDRRSAEKLKSQGNICMGENLYNEAVQCYSEAIETDPYNAVYYCNRAAAYTKLNKNEIAVEDCLRALEIENNYSKAYSRMGLAYSAMRNFKEAIKCYEKALEIEPDNLNYQQNLEAAREQRVLQQETGGSSRTNESPGMGGVPNIGAMFGGSGGGGAGPNIQNVLGNMDLNSILNNPAMMNMAQEFIARPEMRNMMGQMMSQMMGGGGQTSAPNSADANPTNESNDPGRNNNDTSGSNENLGGTDENPAQDPNFENILSFGQQFAQQMQTSHPELIESLRQRHNQQQTANTNASNTSQSSNDTTTNTDNSANNQSQPPQ